MSGTENGGFIGREVEMARLEPFFETPELRAMAVVGEPGIGKSRVMREASRIGRQLGFNVLATNCAHAEMPIAFSGLFDLLDGSFERIAPHLAPSQRTSIEVAIGRRHPAGNTPDPIVLPASVTAALRLIGHSARTLIVVDDPHWLDSSTAAVLTFAIARLANEPLKLIVSGHPDQPDGLGLARTLDGALEQMRLGPLTPQFIRQIVKAKIDLTIPVRVLERICEAAEGNPLLALEFARAQVERDTAPALGLPLPLTPTLTDLVTDRINNLPEEIGPLLAVVAVVGRAEVALLRQVVPGAFDSILDQAVTAGVIQVDGVGLVKFSHPLLASAIYARLAPSERRELHTRIALTAEDIEARGRHLALAHADADPDVARLVTEAASQAAARGAFPVAAELADRAVGLTPASDPVRREERQLLVGEYQCDAQQVAEAAATARQLLDSGVSGDSRVRALFLQFRTEEDGEKRGRVINEALDMAQGDAYLLARALIYASQHEFSLEHASFGMAHARHAVELAEQVGDPLLLGSALTIFAARSSKIGTLEDALLERAIALSDVHGLFPDIPPPRVVLAEAMLYMRGESAQARILLEQGLVRHGETPHHRIRILAGLGFVELYAGRWSFAQIHFEDALELSKDIGDRRQEALLFEPRARLAAYRGEIGEARELANRGIEYGNQHWGTLADRNRGVLGHLELALDEPLRATQYFSGTASRFNFEWATIDAPDAIEALVSCDLLTEAEGLLSSLEQAWEDHRWVQAAALRCRALLLLARGDAPAALLNAEKAEAAFETGGFPFDHGRAVLVAGGCLRRMGKRKGATAKLMRAESIFAGLGAALWLERVDKELGRAKPRRRDDQALTAAEHRVASLAAAGRTNREIAAQLFVSVATVEAHLTRIYRKMRVRSRTELALILAER
jgi:DNA-binding CsgD family transcriptional regulator